MFVVEYPEHDSKACEWAPDRGIERLGSIARAHHDWDWLDWRRDARERRVVVRAHLEESASASSKSEVYGNVHSHKCVCVGHCVRL